MPHPVRPRSHRPQHISGISCRVHCHCWCTLKNYHVNNKYKMELINYPTPRRERRAAYNGDTNVAAIARPKPQPRGPGRSPPSPLSSPLLLLLPPPRSSLVQRLVVALMPPPLILSTLPPPLNAQPRPIEAPSHLVHWCLSSRLPLVCQLVVASPVVACLGLASHFVGQPPHPSILDPFSLFTPAGCCVTSLRTASASQRAGAIAGVIKCTAPVWPPARRKAPPMPLQRQCAAACAPQMHRRRCPDNTALP
jgi:hypothetical protein